MFRIKSLALAATIAFAGFASAAHARDYRDFGILNNNGSSPIVGVWMAHAGTDEAWKPISLAGAIVPGERRTFSVSGPNGDDYFDFRVRFRDGYVATFSNVDLSRVGTLRAD